MRGLSLYLAAGILAVLALDFFAPPAGFGLAIDARPAAERDPIVQFVDRNHKGDRLPVPATSDNQPTMRKNPPVLPIGCEPAFSPLLAGAPKNITGRCIADVFVGHAAIG